MNLGWTGAVLLLLGACQPAMQPRATVPPAPTTVSDAASSGTASSARQGQALYDTHCAFCHGPNGELGGSPLRDAAPNLDGAAIAEVIANGWPARGMPAPPELTPQQIADLIAYIRTWQQ